MAHNTLLARRVTSRDFVDICFWFCARGLNPPDESLFAPTGFIVDNIAAGFVYFTDAPIAIIDGYISNPNVDSKTRSNALDEITKALIKAASERQKHVIKCDSKLEAIKQRASKHGFKYSGSYASFRLEF